MNIKLFLGFLLFLVFNLNAQTPKQKIIDRVTDTYGIKQSVILNNSVYVIGENESSSNNIYPLLIKQDLDLNPEWQVGVIRSSATFYPIIMNGLIATSDNHLLLAGQAGEEIDAPIWIIKMDTLQNIIWEKDINTPGYQVPNDFFANSIGGATILASETIGGIGGINTIQVINFDGNGGYIMD